MMTTNMTAAAINTDADLVNATLAGNRDAFGQIVSRYQSLICSLAYSATGSLGQSEDLAQETFITAWKHLGHLRERDKLRSWLCGIARNRINNFLRREGREPVREAAPLEDATESHAPGPLPLDYAISQEEQAILWRSLERIPEIYREPLVLFYREHQSVEAVAEKLDLTTDTVHQRLSRGRKLLHEQVLAFVEGALGRTNPGKAFTFGVLAALPGISVSSKAAVMGAAAVKGGAMAKGAGLMGIFSMVLTPLLVVFGNYANYRMSMDEAHSDEERWHIKRLFLKSWIFTLAMTAALVGPLYWLCQGQDYRLFWGLLFSLAIVSYFLSVLALALGTLPARRRYLAGVLAGHYGGRFPESAFEYCSRWHLMGLPLLHVRIGDRFDVLRGPVKAWIAIGSSHAVGVIFASGGLAVAPFSFGGIAIGLVPFGAISLGVFSIGAIAIGGWAFGALTAGWQAVGGCCVAWNAAMGAMTIAREYASGGIAYAAQANTVAVAQYLQQHWFFRVARVLADYNLFIVLVSMLPMVVQYRLARRARKRREAVNA